MGPTWALRPYYAGYGPTWALRPYYAGYGPTGALQGPLAWSMGLYRPYRAIGAHTGPSRPVPAIGPIQGPGPEAVLPLRWGRDTNVLVTGPAGPVTHCTPCRLRYLGTC